MIKTKAVFFDLDGTLLHTEPDLAHAVNHALAVYGYPQRTDEEITSYLGAGMLMLVKRALPCELPEEELLKFKNCFVDEYEKHYCDLTVPYDGIVDLVKTLKEKGIKTAVVSNKDEKCALPIVENYFPGLFDSVRGVRDNNDKKPSPFSTFDTMERLGVKAEEVIFVGDGIADIQTARNAGVEPFIVAYGYADNEKLETEYGKKLIPDVETLKRTLLERI